MPARRRRPDGLRAIALIRVSKVGGRDEILSPTLQRTAIADYAAARGMEVVEWVEALDESGSQTKSPWWRRLNAAVERVERGDADAILVWKFSRAARHRRSWAIALDRLEVAGGVLESATEQLDTTTSTGRLARGMLAELAAWEAEVKGEQWKEVFASRLSRGLPASGRERFAYTYSRADGFVPDPETAPLVAAMYDRYLQGDGMPSVAAWLHRQGAVTTRGGPWGVQTLVRYMDTGFAAGWLTTPDGGRVRGVHQPIIPPATFDRYLRERRRRSKLSGRTVGATHPYAGLVVCGHCGGKMHRYPTKDGRHAFRCSVKFRNPALCEGLQVSQATLEEAVKGWLEPMAHELDVRAAALVRHKRQKATVRRTAASGAKTLERLDAALARLTEQMALGEIPVEAYRATRDKLTADRAEAERVVEDATDHAEVDASPAVARSLLGAWDELEARDPKGLRAVLASLIDRIEVGPPRARGGRRDPSRVRVVARWEAATSTPSPGGPPSRPA